MPWYVQNAINLFSHCTRMAVTADIRRTLIIDSLSNKRDLRAAFADLAADLAISGGKAMLKLTHPRITPEAIQMEWARVGLALVPSLRDAIGIEIEDDVASAAQTDRADSMVPLAPPNYRFEVVRLLVERALSGRGPARLKDLISQVGSSKAPIVGAVAALRLASCTEPRTAQTRPSAIGWTRAGNFGSAPAGHALSP